MDANLMGSTGLDFDLKQGKLSALALNTLEYVPVSDGRTAGLVRRGAARGHTSSAYAVPADRGLDRALLRFHPAMNQRQIGLVDLAAGKLAGQFAVCGVGFGNHQQPAGLLIQTMDNTWSQGAGGLRERSKTMEQSVHQSALVTSA